VQSNITDRDSGPFDARVDIAIPAGLPAPDPAALAHVRRVAAHVAQAIADEGGWIPFSAFMRHALYAPGLGYYAAGARKFGAAGDFHTAPEISPLFGQALANLFADVLATTGGGILELGAGSGRLAIDVLGRLAVLDTLPESYAILETSPDLRERQRAALATALPSLAARVQWLDALPAEWTGVVFGNEVLDALPVELLGKDGNAHIRRGVTIRERAFAWRDAHLPPGRLSALIDARFPSNFYESEVNPEAEALTATLGRMLRRGLLLWIDYGFPAREYYHPQRDQGTLMCHYRQYAHDDPLVLPGLQDITAHVDFTAIAEAAREAGLDLVGFASQAQFLIGCGIVDLVAACGEPGTADYVRATSGLQKLLSPAEMGELFKAIGFTRGLDVSLRGFASGTRSL
jgi:SAM-dependent MidA family methyltransferase